MKHYMYGQVEKEMWAVDRAVEATRLYCRPKPTWKNYLDILDSFLTREMRFIDG